MAPIILITVREPKRTKNVKVEKTESEEKPSFLSRLSLLLKTFLFPGMFMLCIAGGIRNAGGYVWAYNTQIFFEARGLKDEINHFMSWIPLAGGSLGVLFGGFISDVLVKNRSTYVRIWVLIVSQVIQQNLEVFCPLPPIILLQCTCADIAPPLPNYTPPMYMCKYCPPQLYSSNVHVQILAAPSPIILLQCTSADIAPPPPIILLQCTCADIGRPPPIILLQCTCANIGRPPSQLYSSNVHVQILAAPPSQLYSSNVHVQILAAPSPQLYSSNVHVQILAAPSPQLYSSNVHVQILAAPSPNYTPPMYMCRYWPPPLSQLYSSNVHVQILAAPPPPIILLQCTCADIGRPPSPNYTPPMYMCIYWLPP